MAVILSGDGNWAHLDESIAGILNAEGISVAGLKSRSYLTSAKRTPESAGRDLTCLLAHYLDAWHADTVLIVGYSRGAELAPFMVSRLPEELRGKIGVVALLSPSPRASFQFHLIDLVSDKSRSTDLPMLPELRAMRGIRVLCVYGSDEAGSSLCPGLDSTLARTAERKGGHHYDKDYAALGRLILGAWRGRPTS